MKLNRKLTYAKQHVASILQHDDESLIVRTAVADELKAFIDAELKAAEAREMDRVKAALMDDPEQG